MPCSCFLGANGSRQSFFATQGGLAFPLQHPSSILKWQHSFLYVARNCRSCFALALACLVLVPHQPQLLEGPEATNPGEAPLASIVN